MTETKPNARRDFLRRAAGAAAILPLAGLGARRAAAQDDLPHAEDGHAQNYVNAAADADHPRYEEGMACNNCVFWQGGDADWGPCQHPQFRDVAVNRNGWCAAYAPGS